MTQSHLRFFSALVVVLLVPLSLPAIDTPLSDTAVREAYFLGQRRDETLARFLDNYTLHLSPPDAGPYIQQVTLLTPYAVMAEFSSAQSDYSAQKAQIDHSKQPEFVRLLVQISLTDSYGPYLMRPSGSRSGSPVGIGFRPSNFWKDFRIRLFNDAGLVIPSDSTGQPTYMCDDQGGCILSGAIVQFEYPAASFDGKTATVQIDPPEGEQVTVEFDLCSLR
jgi:hypothetical protein